MSCNELCSLHFANQFIGVAADAVVVDLSDFDLQLWIDDERATVRHAGVFDVHAEHARQVRGWVGQHWIGDLFDRIRRVVPRFVGEVRIGANRVHFNAHFFELCVLACHITEFGWANKREVCWVEEEHRPLTLEVILGNREEFFVLVCLNFEVADFLIDMHGHKLAAQASLR